MATFTRSQQRHQFCWYQLQNGNLPSQKWCLLCWKCMWVWKQLRISAQKIFWTFLNGGGISRSLCPPFLLCSKAQNHRLVLPVPGAQSQPSKTQHRQPPSTSRGSHKWKTRCVRVKLSSSPHGAGWNVICSQIRRHSAHIMSLTRAPGTSPMDVPGLWAWGGTNSYHPPKISPHHPAGFSPSLHPTSW